MQKNRSNGTVRGNERRFIDGCHGKGRAGVRFISCLSFPSLSEKHVSISSVLLDPHRA